MIAKKYSISDQSIRSLSTRRHAPSGTNTPIMKTQSAPIESVTITGIRSLRIFCLLRVVDGQFGLPSRSSGIFFSYMGGWGRDYCRSWRIHKAAGCKTSSWPVQEPGERAMITNALLTPHQLRPARSAAARGARKDFPKLINNDRNRIRDSEQSRARSRCAEDHSRHNARLRRDRRRKEITRQPTLRHRRANLRNNRNQGRSSIKGRPGIPFPAGLSFLSNSAKLSAFLRRRVLVELLDNLFRQVAYTQEAVVLADLP